MLPKGRLSLAVFPITTGLFLLSTSAVWAQIIPSFERPWLDETGNLRLVLRGGAGVSYTIEGSTNLVDWVALYTGSAADGRLELTSSDVLDGQGFFRCRMDQPVSIDSLAGVWMALNPYLFNSPLYNALNPTPRWYTFYADGLVFMDLPREGLDGFDRTASQADANLKGYWRTYTYQSGSGNIEWPGAIDPTRILFEKPGQIKLDGFSYYRCVSVDGLLLEGAWTSSIAYPDPDDPYWAAQPVGRRSIFRFGKDGRFTDEGAFATLLTLFPDKVQDAAGSGRYDVKNFTLTLRYSDGRVKRVAITGFLSADPATDNNLLYFSHVQFLKMKE